jgi:hypothetical protein
MSSHEVASEIQKQACPLDLLFTLIEPCIRYTNRNSYKKFNNLQLKA